MEWMYFAAACSELGSPSSCHCGLPIQLFSKKSRSGGDLLVTLRPIWPARDLNSRLTAPETNALPLDQLAGITCFIFIFLFLTTAKQRIDTGTKITCRFRKIFIIIQEIYLIMIHMQFIYEHKTLDIAKLFSTLVLNFFFIFLGYIGKEIDSLLQILTWKTFNVYSLKLRQIELQSLKEALGYLVCSK